ncbi:hypothetical protein PoB_003696600 [Plakobranchus ocellatus]|uniref:Uncharacterized protein n=1 Tax=Plakobranchus ocellatus TaxID=259542 RepID=A0AAV4AQN0_9GAST|nr:hypothetical protein PoB_003696600 [Plakobranchus ocellatus]
MEIRQELLNGDENVVTSMDCKYERYLCYLSWRFEAERDMADATGTLTFTCFAFDDLERTEARRYINFRVSE